MFEVDKMEAPRPLGQSLLSRIFTPIFLILFIFNLCLFDLLFRLRTLLPGQLGYECLFKGINRGVLFCLKFAGGLKFSVKGGLAKQDLPILVVSNHQSMFDIPFLCIALPGLRLRFIAKTQLASRIPGISIALRNGEHGIIDRKDHKQALPEITRVARLSIEKGFSIAVFPEGTRSRNGKLRDFKGGGIVKVVESLGEVLLQPVAIKGSWKLAQFALWPLPYGQKVEVCITEPFRVSANDAIESYIERAKRQIQQELDSESVLP